MQRNSLNPLCQSSAIRAEMQRHAAYTVQSTAVSGPILTIFVFLSCRWFVELSCVMLSLNAGKNDSYGFAATAKSSSLSSATFPIRETWMVLCATCIYKFFVQDSRMSLLYKKLGSSVRGLRG